MCGIAGIITKNAESYQDEIEHMISALLPRGPDGVGTKFFQNCVLGHTRLSIIDPESGHQPMDSSATDKTIVFNGEIYGYKNIRNSLSGYQFITNSDTEVILALYELFGIKCLEKLLGMFSFALWDNTNETLFAARDRFGEKPFYYAIGKNGEFIFASEIKAILKTGLITPVLDLISIRHYLQYLYVHPTKTIYSNIYTLPPAHYLVYENGGVIVKRYWEFPSSRINISLEEATIKFRDLLEKSVKKQLVADVPVGAFLSGGLDSSTIVIVAREIKDDLKTISFGFGEIINELPYAQEIADTYKTDHSFLLAENYNIADLLLEMAEVYDEPFADSSNIPMYLISKYASDHLKVVLTGDGADELLGGYDYWYRSAVNMKKKISNNSPLLRLFKVLFRTINEIPLVCRIIPDKIIRLIPEYIKFDTIISSQESQRKVFSDKELSNLIKLSNVYEHEYTYSFQQDGSVNDLLKMDLEDYMPGDILVKTDRASMANGLELRAPFLDQDLAEFCISLPDDYKVNFNESKVILRKSFMKKWPHSISKRGKQGFGAPVTEWLGLHNVEKLKDYYLKNKNVKLFNVMDFKVVQKYISQNNYKTWILLVLSIWMEKHHFELVNNGENNG